jgi:hypothetical protein
MKLPGSLLVSVLPALLAAAAVAPTGAPPAPSAPSALPTPPAEAAEAAEPASQGAPASDYTSEAAEEPLVPEYAPPPMAEPADEDGIRECVGPDGVPVFTDRRCADLGATPQVVLPPIGSAPGGLPIRVRTCARNQGMLLDGVRAALENHDVNRLADYYHWTGMGSEQGYAMMERLDAFSARQVVDVRLVREAQPEAPPDPYEDRFDPLPEEASPPPPPRHRPLASMLRVDQMRSATDVSANVTYFHLLTNAGCWWMRF